MITKRIVSNALSVRAVVLEPLLSALTPGIKKFLHEAIKSLYEKALITENPIDDFFVELLAGLLDVDLED